MESGLEINAVVISHYRTNFVNHDYSFSGIMSLTGMLAATGLLRLLLFLVTLNELIRATCDQRVAEDQGSSTKRLQSMSVEVAEEAT